MDVLTCPKCHGPMRQYERNGVYVDQCGECRGIFLDRGELERLVEAEERFHPESREPRHEPRHEPHRDHRYERRDDDDDDRHRRPRYDSWDHDDDEDHHRRPHDRHHKEHRRRSFLDELFG